MEYVFACIIFAPSIMIIITGIIVALNHRRSEYNYDNWFVRTEKEYKSLMKEIEQLKEI